LDKDYSKQMSVIIVAGLERSLEKLEGKMRDFVE